MARSDEIARFTCSVVIGLALNMAIGCGGGGSDGDRGIEGGGSGTPPDTVAPTVISTTPADGSVDIAADAGVSFTFSEAMDETTITTGNLILSPALSGTLAYDAASNTATFYSSNPMGSLVPYTVTVTPGCADVAGNALTAGYTWSFTTVMTVLGDRVAPTVISTTPADGSVDIAADAGISFTFSEAMDETTMTTDNLIFSPALSGTLSYDAVSNTATFYSSNPMGSMIPYTVTVTPGCIDVAGNALAAGHTWSFTTTMNVLTDWVRVGEQIGVNGAEAEDPTICFVDGIPVVGYRHTSFEIALNHWDGMTWGTTVGDPSSGNMNYTSYHAPSICSNGNTLFMAYSLAGISGGATDEFYDRIFVHSWSPVGGWADMNAGDEISVVTTSPPGANAFEPAIACTTGGEPWVSWLEDDFGDSEDTTDNVGLARVTSISTADRISPPLSRNTSSGDYFTAVRTTEVLINGVGRYVAQWEHDAFDSDRTDLYVTNYASGTRSDMGGIIDSDYDSNNLCKPSMAVWGGQLHIAYTTMPGGGSGRHVYVKRWTGGAWLTVGGGPVTAFPTDHFDSAHPSLLVANSTLYVAWNESSTYEGSFIFVASLDAGGTDWEIDGNRLNVDPSRAALDPCLATDGIHLYVAFEEFTDGYSHIFVKRRQFQ